MSKNWEPTPLGDLLIRSDKVVNINPLETYKQVTVRLWGQGVILRDEVTGSEISASKRYEVKPKQFILSKIDARNGAFGLVPPDLDGAVVSGDFPVFDINPDRLEPKFLEWKSKTREFVDLCRLASEGTTNRVRLKENKFLRLKFPLPPLPEQRRIVAKVEALAAKIEEARGLRAKAADLCDKLLKISSRSFFKANGSADFSLGDTALRITKGESPSWQGFSYQESGPIFLRSENVLWGKLDLTHVSHQVMVHNYLIIALKLVNNMEKAPDLW